MKIATLKRTSEFQRLRGGLRWSGPGFLIEGKARLASAAATAAAAEGPRFGFTITKKLGGAVERNRIRRRLKHALRSMPCEVAMPGFDYVIVARACALDREFSSLTGDFRNALQHIRRAAEKASMVPKPDASQGPAAAGNVTGRLAKQHTEPDPSKRVSRRPKSSASR